MADHHHEYVNHGDLKPTGKLDKVPASSNCLKDSRGSCQSTNHVLNQSHKPKPGKTCNERNIHFSFTSPSCSFGNLSRT